MTDTASKIKGLAWVIVAVLFGAGIAFGIAPFVRLIPWSWEKNVSHYLGSTSSIDVCVGSPQKQALLKQLVIRLYPLDREDGRFSIDVKIVNNPEINAFAELGGKISLDRGLLEKAESPEEVAGVLAHEITHVSRRHILEGFIVHVMTFGGIQMIFGPSSNVGWTNYFLNMGFTRSQEAEADHGALQRLQKAHIDNRGFGQFFERLKEMSSSLDFLSDHPSSQSRQEMVKNYQNEATKPVMTKEEWKTFQSYCQ